MLKALFLDIDETLIHKEECSDCKKIGNAGYWTHKEVLKALSDLKKVIPIVPISGRRSTSFSEIKENIPYTVAILEHGGLFLPNNYISKKWSNLLYPACKKDGGYLWNFAKELERKGYNIDKKGRKSSFWICSSSNTKKFLSPNEHSDITTNLPNNLEVVQNKGMVGIIPTISGKLNSAKFYCNELNINLKDTFFIGDDDNDLKLLSNVGRVATFKNAHPEAVSIVEKRTKNGYIAKSGHTGTIDILNNIKKEIL